MASLHRLLRSGGIAMLSTLRASATCCAEQAVAAALGWATAFAEFCLQGEALRQRLDRG